MNKHQKNLKTMKYLLDYNGSKILKEGKSWELTRTRRSEPTYLLVTYRGNYYKSFIISYLYEDKPINAFWFTVDTSKVVIKKKAILKVPKTKPLEFITKLMELTPDFGWFDDTLAIARNELL